GQVVELDGGLDPGVGGTDLHPSPGVGVHRPDVHLVAVAAGGGGPVVADGDGQEMEHEVGVGDVVVAAHEPAALEVVGGAGTSAEQPHQADDRAPPPRQPRCHRHRLGAGVLDVH